MNGDDVGHDDSRLAAGLEEKRGQSSIVRVTFNFVNAMVGSGILAIPYAFLHSGLALGMAICVVICVLADYTVRLLVRVGIREGVKNYEELMDKLFGLPGYAAVLLALFLYDFGAMLAYLIILGDVSTSIVKEVGIKVFGVSPSDPLVTDYWTVRRFCIALISCVIILPLCLLRDVSKLERTSVFAVFTTVAVICAVFIKALVEERHGSGVWLTVVGDNPSAALGILAFAFVCHDTAFLFYGSLRNASSSRWRKTTQLSLGLGFLICMCLAVPGYSTFTTETKGNILQNYDQADPVFIVVRLLFLLSTALTYPLTFFICRHILNEVAYRWQFRKSIRTPGTPSGLSIEQNSTSRHLILSISLFAISLVIVMFVDKLGFVMSVTGSITAVAIAFVFPPLCSIRSRNLRRSRGRNVNGNMLWDEGSEHLTEPLLEEGERGLEWDFLLDYILVLFGGFTMLFCTYQNILNS